MNFIEYLMIYFGLYLLVSSSLNLEVGYAGIPNFGKALSFAVGILAVYPIWYSYIQYFNTNPILSILFLVVILITSFIIGFIVGLAVTVPAIRLREDYLAMYLLGVAVIIIYVLHYAVFYCPETGNYFISLPHLFEWAGPQRDFAWSLTILIVSILALFGLNKLCNTPFGRILKAIRENELVVETFGRNVIWFKLVAMAIGSGVAAVGGALYALCFANASIGINAQLYWTFIPWLIILLGGLGNMYGILLGTLIFSALQCAIRTYGPAIKNLLALPVPISHIMLWVVFGSIILIILIFRPEGIIPEKPILTKPIKKLKERMKQKQQSRDRS